MMVATRIPRTMGTGFLNRAARMNAGNCVLSHSTLSQIMVNQAQQIGGLHWLTIREAKLDSIYQKIVMVDPN